MGICSQCNIKREKHKPKLYTVIAQSVDVCLYKATEKGPEGSTEMLMEVTLVVSIFLPYPGLYL